MRFKKFVLASGFSLLAGSIVVPVASSVNRVATNHCVTQMQLADGMPLPPPPKTKGTTLVADGMPLPPPPRKGKGTMPAAV
jgi:hypothetical protein